MVRNDINDEFADLAEDPVTGVVIAEVEDVKGAEGGEAMEVLEKVVLWGVSFC